MGSAVRGLENQKGRQACGSRLPLSRGLHQFFFKSSIDDWLLHASRLPQVDSISTNPEALAHFGSSFLADHEFDYLH